MNLDRLVCFLTCFSNAINCDYAFVPFIYDLSLSLKRKRVSKTDLALVKDVCLTSSLTATEIIIGLLISMKIKSTVLIKFFAFFLLYFDENMKEMM